MSTGNIDIRARTDGAGALVSISGSNSYNNSGTITAVEAATIGAAAGASLDLTGSINLANNVTFAGAGNFNVSAATSGAGNLIKTGSGTLLFSGTGSDINGNRLDVLEGTVELNRPGRLLNTVQHTIVGTTSGPAATLRLLTSNQIRDDHFVNVYESGTFNLNNHNEGLSGLRLYGGTIMSGTGTLSIVNAGGDEIHSYASSQTATISGNIRSDLAQGITITTDQGQAAIDLDISAAFSGSVVTVTKQGDGLLQFSGTQANTYTGQTIINAGTVLLNKTAGVDAIAGSSITVNSGGTLRLANNNQINNTTPLALNGGTFSTGATTGYSDTLGTLTLSSTSTLDLGTGVHQLVFANSSAIVWSGTLLINGWTGAGASPGTQGQIFFGVGGLTSTQLAQISFDGFQPGAMLLASGELVPIHPIPEAKVVGGAIALAAFVAWCERRRLGALLFPAPALIRPHLQGRATRPRLAGNHCSVPIVLGFRFSGLGHWRLMAIPDAPTGTPPDRLPHQQIRKGAAETRAGTWQHAMLQDNIEALRMASALLRGETDDAKGITQADLRKALKAFASMIDRTAKSQEKFPPGTSQHTLQRNRLAALRTAEARLKAELETD